MRTELADWLRDAWQASGVQAEALAPLRGGAIQENWRLDVAVDGGPRAGAHALVLRLDAAALLPMSHGRGAEFALLSVAHAAGVSVPEPLALCTDARVLGRAFFLMRRVAGSADARALTTAGADAGLVRALGGELARLHRVMPPCPALGFLGPPPANAALARVAELHGLLDGLGDPRPALEWGLAWLVCHAPPPVRAVLCHRDFRTGNFLVHEGRVAAVLDWEFAAWSDPAEDFGWITAPCWRFRRPDLEAGGLGSLGDLAAGYAGDGGAVPDPDRLRWWQTMATARWAVIALWQAERHRSGVEPSLELALTAHLVPELELELLTMTAAG